MKILITGGHKGLGLYLAEHLGADSISRIDGFDITKDEKKIAEKSLEYDVFINNAFDGPPHLPENNFGQVNVYLAVYEAWKNANKTGHIFNLGSIGAKIINAPEPRHRTYITAKAAIEFASKQGTLGFKKNQVKFKTTLITMDKLDTQDPPHWKPEWREAFWPPLDKWEDNGLNLKNIHDFIEFCLKLDDNACIEETIFYCNLEIRR